MRRGARVLVVVIAASVFLGLLLVFDSGVSRLPGAEFPSGGLIPPRGDSSIDPTEFEAEMGQDAKERIGGRVPYSDPSNRVEPQANLQIVSVIPGDRIDLADLALAGEEGVEASFHVISGRVSVPPGRWTIRTFVDDEGHVPVFNGIDVRLDEQNTLWVSRQLSVQGFVKGVQGEPISGAIVEWRDATPVYLGKLDSDKVANVTGIDGSFQLANILAGAGRLVASAAGYVPQSVEVNPKENLDLTIHLRLDRGRGTPIVLTTPDDRPLVGGSLMSIRGLTSPHKSDQYGVLTIPRWLDISDWATLRGPGIFPVQQQVRDLDCADGKRVPWVGEVQFEVLFLGGEQHKKWDLFLTPSAWPGDLIGGLSMETLPERVSWFGKLSPRVSLPQGVPFRLLLTGPNGEALRDEFVLGTQLLKLELRPKDYPSLRLLFHSDSSGNRPIAMVTKWGRGKRSTTHFMSRDGVSIPLVAGLQYVSFSGPGFLGMTIVPDSAIELAGQLNLPLEPSASLNVNVAFESGEPVAGVIVTLYPHSNPMSRLGGEELGAGIWPTGHPGWTLVDRDPYPSQVTGFEGVASFDTLWTGEFTAVVSLGPLAMGEGLEPGQALLKRLVYISSERATASLTIKAPRAVSLTVLDAFSRLPLRKFEIASGAALWTGSDGFWQGYLAGGAKSLHVSANGYAPQDAFMASDEDAVVEVSLEPSVWCEVVVDEAPASLEGKLIAVLIQAPLRSQPEGALRELRRVQVEVEQESFRLGLWPRGIAARAKLLPITLDGQVWRFQPAELSLQEGVFEVQLVAGPAPLKIK